ncbi:MULTISPECIES: hypothetical protein [Nonomuraea]|uniref:Trypsin-like peptidase domain-containing protein n=1 Tax=Nonomuraea salmonea TaxID=46181 RepID=A0ABV5NYA4_9ACTN
MPNEEFLAPSGLPEPFPSVADDVMARAAGAVTDAALRDVTSPIRDAHGELEDALMRIHREGRPGAQDVDSFLRPSGAVQAVAIGLGEPGSAFAPGEPALTVYTAEPTETSTAREMVVDGLGVSSARDVPMMVRHGVFDAQPHRFRIRPAPGGVSTGHTAVTAGTLGCLAVGRSAPRNQRLMLLSNNHVLADENKASLNDPIVQPGSFDGGTSPADQIAVLERFRPIAFGGAPNLVDCAVAWCWPERVRRELTYVWGGGQAFFRISSAPVAPAFNMVVGKTGRTTQLRQGVINGLAWSGFVNYDSGPAFFTNQIAIRPIGAPEFSAGGDSGSIVWAWSGALPPVGLLFAGSTSQTLANPIRLVLDALDINLHT